MCLVKLDSRWPPQYRIRLAYIEQTEITHYTRKVSGQSNSIEDLIWRADLVFALCLNSIKPTWYKMFRSLDQSATVFTAVKCMTHAQFLP